MTCIVGLVQEGVVYIGGERGTSDNDVIISMATPKVRQRGDWVYGYAGSIGIGQLLDITPLPVLEENDDVFFVLRTTVVEELKDIIDKYSEPQSDRDTSWLIGARGRLFELNHTDWSVVEVNHTAIGSGGNYALGSLHTSGYVDDNELTIVPEVRMALALSAAISYSPTCLGPVDILYI